MKNQTVELDQGVLTLKDCILMGIGGMVGSAIFTISGVTYLISGPSAILGWVIAGLILLIYSLNIAELATIFPRSGGLYVYPYEVFGKTRVQKNFAGWFAAWSRLNSSILGTSFSAIFVAQYIGAIIPGAEKYKIIFAVSSIILCFLLNALGVSFIGKVSSILAYILMFMCGVYVIAGAPNIDLTNFTPFFGQGTMGTKGFFASIPMAMVAYGSIIAIASVAEEIKEPKKTIPKATIISIAITVVMYVALLVVTFGLVPASQFVDNDFAIYSPMYYALTVGAPKVPWLSIAISIAALFALITTLLILTMESSRIIMTSAKSGLLPKSMGEINAKTKTPVNALFVASLVAALIACFPQFTMEIVGTGSFCSGIVVIILTITLIVARKKGITSKGSYKVPGGLILPIMSMLVVAVTLTQLERSAFILSTWWYIVGLAIFIASYIFNKEVLNASL